MSKLLAFSSVEEAVAGLSHPRARFLCSICGQKHVLSKRDWVECAFKIASQASFKRPRYSVPDGLFLVETAEAAVTLPEVLLLGRERLLDEVSDMRMPSGCVAPLPAALAVERKVLEQATDASRERWWEGVISVLSALSAVASRWFPDPPRPALKIPALVRCNDPCCSFVCFDKWALVCAHLNVHVVFYPGIVLRLAVPDAGVAVARILSSQGEAGAVEMDSFGRILGRRRSLNEVARENDRT